MALDVAAALETVGIGAWDLDVTTGCMTWSDSARELLGLTDDDADLETLMQRVCPQDSDQVRYAVMRAIIERTPLSERFGLLESDGGVNEVELRARVTGDAQGRPRRLIGVCFTPAQDALSAA